MRALPLILTALGQAGVLGAIEVLGRWGLRPELTRRLAYVVGAASVAVLPFFLTLTELVVLGVFFTGVLAWTWLRHQLDSVHAVQRPTVGALVFPAGLLAGAWVGWGHLLAIAFGALVLALADPCAAWVGGRSRGPGWRVPGGRKTLAGAAAFVVTTVGVGVALAGFSPGRLPALVAAALLLAAVEATVGYGLDNLSIPPLASLLATTWLGM